MIDRIKTAIYKPFMPLCEKWYGCYLVHLVGFGLVGLLALIEPFMGWFPRTSLINVMMFAIFCSIVWEMFWHLMSILGLTKSSSYFNYKDVIAGGLGGLLFGTLAYLILSDLPFYVPLGG